MVSVRFGLREATLSSAAEKSASEADKKIEDSARESETLAEEISEYNKKLSEFEELNDKTQQEIADTLFAASGYSVYSVAEQMKKGFLTGPEGERIGIAGSYVYENGGVLSVHAVTSLCIRVPHAVEGCAEEIYARCLSEGMCSLILLSHPGEGKTTLLRDLSRLVCERRQLNVLVSDERGELSAGDLGRTADVIRFADKLTAFTAGIRAMRPDLIVTDELLPEDYTAVARAIGSGIKVFASAHLVRAEDVPQKLFDRYILLDGLGRIGTVLGAGAHAVA